MLSREIVFRKKENNQVPIEIADGVIFLTELGNVVDFKPSSILYIGAHPDDIEVQCGGALTRFKDIFDAKNHVIVATDGSKGNWHLNIPASDFARLRSREQELVANSMEFASLEMMGYPDGELEKYAEEFRKKIVRLIRMVKPDLVVTHDPEKKYEFHPDHKMVAAIATESAAILAANCGYYPEFELEPHFVPYILLFDSPNPNLGVILDQHNVTVKLGAMKTYRSQFELRPQALESAYRTMSNSGRLLGSSFAELFHLYLNA